MKKKKPTSGYTPNKEKRRPDGTPPSQPYAIKFGNINGKPCASKKQMYRHQGK